MATSIVFRKVFFVLVLATSIAASQSSASCSETTTCSARGVCVVPPPTDTSASLCVCDDGYTTHPMPADNTTPDVVYCNYQQKDQLTAFLLAFFLGGVGAGRFYVGNWTLAVFKLLFCTVLPCCLPCCLLPCAMVSGARATNAYQPIPTDAGGDAEAAALETQQAMTRNMLAMGGTQCCCLCVWMLGCFAWCLTDIILFALNDVKDGNGVELAPW